MRARTHAQVACTRITRTPNSHSCMCLDVHIGARVPGFVNSSSFIWPCGGSSGLS